MPEIEFAFLADAASTEPGQKFHVLGGGVQRIAGRSLPVVHPHLALVVALTVTPSEIGRPHDLRIVVLGPDGKEIASAEGSIVPHGYADGRETLLTFSVDLWNLAFPAAGDYSVRLLVNGSERKRLPLIVSVAGEGGPRRLDA